MSFFKTIRDALLPVTRRSLEKRLHRQNKELDKRFEKLFRKLSMPDDIWQLGDIRIYVPNYPLDGVQSIIVDNNTFYEAELLKALDELLPHNPVICDIGANIGNHSLYWLSRSQASYIYCFEPRLETYRILEKNISLNGFNDRVSCLNIALSDKCGSLTTQYFNLNNIGANRYNEDQSGKTKSIPLDSLSLERKIDLIKIDVEGMESHVLNGARQTISKDLPIIFLETFPQNKDTVHVILSDMGYTFAREFGEDNYLYIPG